MSSHDVSFSIPQKMVLAKDVTFIVNSDGARLGKLLISKGNIEWVPASKSVKKYRLSWENFDKLMQNSGTMKRQRK